jgi:phosphate uptake regulator
MAITPKKSFEANHKESPEERQVVALEFIAHYLDRIEDHLARIAKAAVSPVVEKEVKDALLQAQLAKVQIPKK